MRRLLVVLWVCLLAAPVMAVAQPKLGAVQFANSGAAPAQAPFLRGLGWLHNFQYDDAAAAFREAQAADPNFALAYWGEAMTYNHPVWMEQDADKARAVLARLGPTPEARLARAGTPREAAYLRAVEVLYGPGDKEDRDRRYAAEMAELHRRFPDDVDAAAFHALALLGTAHNGRDVATYMQSAALLEEVYPDHRDHPGVLHYLIHSYDDPAHAPLGLRAARLYGDVAQGAPHALHMTSHIFLALGLWDDVVASNVAATDAAAARARAAGRTPIDCGHAHEWLVYAYMQQRRTADVERRLAACRATALAELKTSPQTTLEAGRSSVPSYAQMLARQAIETGRWQGDEALVFEPGAYLHSRYALAYGEALSPQTDAARRQALSAEIAALRKALADARGPGEPDALAREELRIEEVMAAQAAALAAEPEAGLAELSRLAELEASYPIEFGPPAVYKPSWELLGDRLLALGRRAEAAAAYRAALARAPGRALSLAGLEAAGA